MTTMMNTDNAVLEFGDPQFQVQSQALCPSHLLRPAHHLLIWRRTRQVGFEYFKFAIPKNGFGFTDNFRFATVKYDHTGKNLWNPCMHLCNYSINKYHSGLYIFFGGVCITTNHDILIIQERRFWPFFSQTTSRAVILTSMTRSLPEGDCLKQMFHKKYFTNDNWMLYHIRATNGLWVPFSSTWRRTISTRSNWCRASRTWSSRSLWYSRNIFLLS